MIVVRRVIVTVVGGTVLTIGIALLVLPGPAFLVIPLGLAILATEYVWARRWLKRAKNMANPKKARRTTRALRFAFNRRRERVRLALQRWMPWLWKPPPPSSEPVRSSEPLPGAGRATEPEPAPPSPPVTSAVSPVQPSPDESQHSSADPERHESR